MMPGSRAPSALLRRLLLLGALCLGGNLQAANDVVSPAYVNPLRSYGTEQGLPQASALALLEGRDGYLWVGTLGGLARFDGRTFTTFRAGNEGIAGNRIQALYQDDQQRIWVGTQDAGISIYENGEFHKLDFCGGTCRINSLLPAGDGRSLWVRSSSGIFRMDIATVKARPISQNNDVLDAMTALGNGQLYAGGRAGLFRFEEGKPDEKVALPAGSSSVRSMSSMRARYLWVITDSSRLYRYDPNESSWSLLAGNLPETAQFVRNDDANVYLAGLPDTDIQQMHEDGSQTALSGTARIPQPRMLHTDAQGNRWIGTAAQGLWRLQTSRIGLFNDPALGLDGSGRALAEDADGGIWFGMNCGGLRHWNKDGRLESVSLQAVLDNECVYSLARDDRDRLWIGSVNGRLARLENGTLTLVGDWPELREINIWQDPRDGQFWMSSLRDTWRLQLDAQGNVAERVPVPALHDVAIAWMTPARAGGTWFLGDNGAYRVQGNEQVEQWSAEQLGMRFLRGIHEDPDGSVWLGSYGNGLVRIAEGKVQHYGTRDGLYDDTVSCILPDAKGRLWLGGNLGISLLAKPPGGDGEIAPAPLTSRDGLVPDELNGGSVSACLRDARGRLWFSLLRGFAVIDPLAFTDEALAPPQVHIERLRVAGKNLLPESYVQLDGDVSNLGISYTAIDLANPDRLRFRYRLLPEGKEWVDAGDLRNVLLPSLPWGKFSFEVQARHTNGPWSPSAAVQFQRPMPWFRLQWLWLILVLGGLLGMLWFMRDQH